MSWSTVSRRVLAGLALLTATVWSATPALAGNSAVPYTDPAQNGFIQLCDATGHPVTSGSLDSVPFVWRAVSTTAAEPAVYGGVDRSATLFAVTPREGVTPGEWIGGQLTFTTRYTNPRHPMTVGDRRDISLRQYVDTNPPHWGGLVQLRMYLSRPGFAAYTLRYAATDIRISGSSWAVVRGAAGNACRSGSAKSAATLLKLPSYHKKGQAAAPAPARNIAVAAAMSDANNASANAASADADLASSSNVGGRSAGGGVWITPLVVGLALAGAILVGGVAARRMRASTTATEQFVNRR